MKELPVGRWPDRGAGPWSLWVAAFTLALAGCGTNLNEVLFQAGAATGRTLVDTWLTDFANRFADSFDTDDAASDDDDSTTDDGDDDPNQDDDDAVPVDGDGPNGAAGDVATGEKVYTTNNCSACHCADASGGCALSAPPVLGVGQDTLDAVLRGDAPHPSKVDVSDQDLADLEAYLASLAQGGG